MEYQILFGCHMCGNESIFDFEQYNLCNMNENIPVYFSCFSISFSHNNMLIILGETWQFYNAQTKFEIWPICINMEPICSTIPQIRNIELTGNKLTGNKFSWNQYAEALTGNKCITGSIRLTGNQLNQAHREIKLLWNRSRVTGEPVRDEARNKSQWGHA